MSINLIFDYSNKNNLNVTTTSYHTQQKSTIMSQFIPHMSPKGKKSITLKGRFQHDHLA